MLRSPSRLDGALPEVQGEHPVAGNSMYVYIYIFAIKWLVIIFYIDDINVFF